MSLIEHQDLVEHFLAHATHPSFSKWISIECLKRRMDDTDLLGLENRVEGFGQLAVIVMNQATKSFFPFFDGPDVLASLLSHTILTSFFPHILKHSICFSFIVRQ